MKPKRFGIGALLLLFSAGICRGEGLQIETSNAALQRLFGTAMERAAANLRDYADGRRVLVEGWSLARNPTHGWGDVWQVCPRCSHQ